MCALCGVRPNIKPKDRQSRAAKAIRDKKIKRLIVIGIVAALAIGIGLAVVSSKVISGASAAPPIDNIPCNSMEQLTFHIHAHLDIFINGQPYTIPSQTGIPANGNCFYWMHTHDNSGIIHIEAPKNMNFTLGNFFDIWNKKFNNSQIFDNIVNGNNTLSVYVNGHKVAASNYRDIKLNSHDEVAIVYGSKPPKNVPSTYNFAEGL